MSKKPKTTKLSKKSKREVDPPDPSTLPGWPGYRTRAGRSGYDPVDSRAEGGHMLGVLIRQFFTLQLKTGNPVYRLLLAAAGVVLVLPAGFAVVETWRGNPMPWDAWIVLGVAGMVGLAALANFVINLIRK